MHEAHPERCSPYRYPVVDVDAAARCQFLQSLHMTFCQVYDMDIVTHTCSVRCIVIVTENAQTFQFTHSYLCNVGNQVVRDTLRILAE